MPPDTARALSTAVAASLVKRNIPAFTETGNRESLVLGGRIDDGSTAPRIDWRLIRTGRNGGKAERIVTAAPPAVLSPGDAGLLTPIADTAASAVAALIQNPFLQDRTATLKKRYLHVTPISGAPDAAGAVLQNEIENALRRRALRVSTRMREDSLFVVGSISLSDGKKGKKRMSVEWTVLRADGLELGKLSQHNDVAPAELDGDWPAIARGIALSAAPGLKELLDKIPEKAIEPQPDRK
ncbi:MAG: hypothetical protein ACPGRZ_14195 [Alphaproteobacteria bacterium]